MILFATPSRVLNRSVLEITSAPRKFLGRGFGVVPKSTVRESGFWRLLAEFQLLRYLLALTPFPVAMVFWPHLALPISQAPLLMFILIWLVESRVLSVPREARKTLVSEVEAARTLDMFRVRAADILTRIVSGRGMTSGEVFLVVEQSELARLPPLSVVSLQKGAPGAEVLELSDTEQELIAVHLFGDGFEERRLHRVNLAENTFLRSVALDAATISAHARLEAMATARG